MAQGGWSRTEDQKWVRMNGHGDGRDGLPPGRASAKDKKLKLKVKLRGIGPDRRSEPHQQAGPAAEEPEPVNVAKQLRSAQKVMTLAGLTSPPDLHKPACQTKAKKGRHKVKVHDQAYSSKCPFALVYVPCQGCQVHNSWTSRHLLGYVRHVQP